MPGTPQPAGEGPNRLPVLWNAMLQKLKAVADGQAAINAAKTSGATLDQYGNVMYLQATNLAQQVTIGAAFQQPGVPVMTGLTGAGIAKQTGLVTTTITLTKGSASATVGTTSLSNGMQIGAANVTDPSTGTPTPAITPGTTVLSGGGTTSITLSLPAAESGTALYCAACTFSKL